MSCIGRIKGVAEETVPIEVTGYYSILLARLNVLNNLKVDMYSNYTGDQIVPILKAGEIQKAWHYHSSIRFFCDRWRDIAKQGVTSGRMCRRCKAANTSEIDIWLVSDHRFILEARNSCSRLERKASASFGVGVGLSLFFFLRPESVARASRRAKGS